MTRASIPTPVNLDDWVMLSAKKTKHRSKGEAERSQWLITLQNIHTNEQYQFSAAAEHKDHAKTLRSSAYLPSSSAAVKTVTPSDVAAPACILKSFLSEKIAGQQKSLIDRRQRGKLTSVDYLQIFGCPAVVVERQKPTNASNSKPKKSLAIMMVKLGDHDLIDAIEQRQEGTPPRWMTESSTADKEIAFAQLLAYVAFFHQQENRPILDLKPDNLIPIIKDHKLTGLKLIDLESSVGHHLIASVNSLHPKDKALYLRVLPHPWAHGSLTPAIDIRTLGNILRWLLGKHTPAFHQLWETSDDANLDATMIEKLFPDNPAAIEAFKASLTQCHARHKLLIRQHRETTASSTKANTHLSMPLHNETRTDHSTDECKVTSTAAMANRLFQPQQRQHNNKIQVEQSSHTTTTKTASIRPSSARS
jgi:hypothetical protein